MPAAAVAPAGTASTAAPQTPTVWPHGQQAARYRQRATRTGNTHGAGEAAQNRQAIFPGPLPLHGNKRKRAANSREAPLRQNARNSTKPAAATAGTAASAPLPSGSVLSQHGELITELIDLAVAAGPKPDSRVPELAGLIEVLGEEIRQRVTSGCAELENVGAGLDSVLTLADMQSERSEDAYGMYCLLKLLKQQLDKATGQLRQVL